MVINCSEPVRHRDQEKFYRRFASRGLGEKLSPPVMPWRDDLCGDPDTARA